MNIKTVTPETAFALYLRLEYYRAYLPSIYNMTEDQYASTEEAKRTDLAIKAYRDETGAEDNYERMTR